MARTTPRILEALTALSLGLAACNNAQPNPPGESAEKKAAPAAKADPAEVPGEAPASTPPAPTPPATAGGSIGSATMEADGTIVLQLRAEGDGAVGDALLRYPPGHEQYAMIRAHVGPIEPGQSRPVAPFPENVWRFRVKKQGTELGTIEVRAGEAGRLTLTGQGKEAEALAAMWREIEASKSFSLNVHVPTADGSRGAYGSRIYRVGDDDYGSGVHGKLLAANYDVDVLARGQ